VKNCNERYWVHLPLNKKMATISRGSTSCSALRGEQNGPSNKTKKKLLLTSHSSIQYKMGTPWGCRRPIGLEKGNRGWKKRKDQGQIRHRKKITVNNPKVRGKDEPPDPSTYWDPTHTQKKPGTVRRIWSNKGSEVKLQAKKPKPTGLERGNKKKRQKPGRLTETPPSSPFGEILN